MYLLFTSTVPRKQIVAMYVSCRRRCCKLPVNYTPVNHGLDEEEMAFKRTMEEQHGDDIDEVELLLAAQELLLCSLRHA